MPSRISFRPTAAVLALVTGFAAAPAQAAWFEVATYGDFLAATFEIVADGKLYNTLDLAAYKGWQGDFPAGTRIQVTTHFSQFDRSFDSQLAGRGIDASCTRTFWMDTDRVMLLPSGGLSGPVVCKWMGGLDYPKITVPKPRGGPATPPGAPQ